MNLLDIVSDFLRRLAKPLVARVAEGFDLSPPLVGEVVTLTISTTSQKFRVPDAWRGRYVACTVRTTDGGIAFTDSAGKAVATLTAASTIDATTFVINPGNGSYPLPQDQERVFGPFPPAGQGCDWCCIVGAAAGTLFAAPASGVNQLRDGGGVNTPSGK